MRFKDLFIGTIFKFHFDGNASWWYLKTGSNKAVCIEAPELNKSAIGKEYEIKDECYDSCVHIGHIALSK